MFQSTPPAWGATPASGNNALFWWFQSTPPAWGATFWADVFERPFNVSIHAPRVGGDSSLSEAGGGTLVSIHAPRVGGDRSLSLAVVVESRFNPRPPRGGRRELLGWAIKEIRCFNPRPPRGGRRARCTSNTGCITFQSTPP